jgi:hypothetical protein
LSGSSDGFVHVSATSDDAPDEHCTAARPVTLSGVEPGVASKAMVLEETAEEL